MKTHQTIQSPCNSICTMNEQSGLCNGCMRTIEEIMDWGNASNERKQSILDLIDARWFNTQLDNEKSQNIQRQKTDRAG